MAGPARAKLLCRRQTTSHPAGFDAPEGAAAGWQVSRLADVEACASMVGPPSRPDSQWHWATSPVTVAGAAALLARSCYRALSHSLFTCHEQAPARVSCALGNNMSSEEKRLENAPENTIQGREHMQARAARRFSAGQAGFARSPRLSRAASGSGMPTRRRIPGDKADRHSRTTPVSRSACDSLRSAFPADGGCANAYNGQRGREICCKLHIVDACNRQTRRGRQAAPQRLDHCANCKQIGCSGTGRQRRLRGDALRWRSIPVVQGRDAPAGSDCQQREAASYKDHADLPLRADPRTAHE